MGTVRWTWKDDTRKKNTFEIENVLYFSQSPVNVNIIILSVTSLADQLQDDEGIGIDTKRYISRLYWNNNKFAQFIMVHIDYQSSLSMKDFSWNDSSSKKLAEKYT